MCVRLFSGRMLSRGCFWGRRSSFAQPLPASGAQQSFCHVCICVRGNVPANLLCVLPFKQPWPQAATNRGVTKQSQILMLNVKTQIEWCPAICLLTTC